MNGMHDCFSKTPTIIEVERELLDSVQRINTHLGIKHCKLFYVKYKIIFIYLFITHFMWYQIFLFLEYIWSTKDTKYSYQKQAHLVIILGL